MAKRANPQSNTSITISVEEKKKLVEIARDLGYTQTRGAGVGVVGNYSALIRAIANGDLIVTSKEDKNALSLNNSDEE